MIMTKAKKAVKEVNQMADRAILKAKLAGIYAAGLSWLNSDVHGFKRGKILLAAVVLIVIVSTAS
jgi:hypothetical protein